MAIGRLGDPGDEYNRLVAAQRAITGPSADPYAGAPSNTGAYYNTEGSDSARGVNPEPVFAGGTAPAQGFGGVNTSAAGYGGIGITSDMGASYSLPDSAGASQALRDLQMGATSGLQGLVGRDTSAARQAIEDALYQGQAEGINTAADRSRAAMLEGTFGRGVGSSTITKELYGRGEQERADALARARREAFTQAGSEDRADLASQLGLYNTSGSLATAGLQGEANVALTNLARQQQESQFARNLGFQGSENAATRAQQASEFGQNLGLNYAQLGQQASQFGQNLAFQGSESALNRSLQQALQESSQAFTGSENAANRATTTSEAALNRALQQYMLESQQGFQGGENAANRALQQALQESSQSFTGGENAASRALQQALQESSQSFTGGQNEAARQLQATQFGQTMGLNYAQLGQQQSQFDENVTQAGLNRETSVSEAALNRALQQMLTAQGQEFTGAENEASRNLQRYLAETGQTFTGTQNQLNRDATMQALLLQLANRTDIAEGTQAAGIGSAAAGGIGALLGPLLARWAGLSSQPA